MVATSSNYSDYLTDSEFFGVGSRWENSTTSSSGGRAIFASDGIERSKYIFTTRGFL